MKNIQLTVEKARELYKTASVELKQILEANFTPLELAGKITDRVKTWNDILYVSPQLNWLAFTNPVTKEEKSVNAFMKIQVIAKVLNEGWVPDFTNHSEYKWYPYFEKKSSGWVLGGARCFGWLRFLGSSVAF